MCSVDETTDERMPHTVEHAKRKNQPKRSSCLLLLDAGVIACDLTQIILCADPGSSVTLVQTAEAARAHVDGATCLTFAILSLGPERVVAAGLDRAIEAKGGRLFLMGDDADMTGHTGLWPVINRPFSTDSILEVLRREGAISSS